MNAITRIKMLKAMELIARTTNNEEAFYDIWLTDGIADGDIALNDLSVGDFDPQNLGDYLTDDTFADMMAVFLRLMFHAHLDGGLWCDGVCSAEPENG